MHARLVKPFAALSRPARSESIWKTRFTAVRRRFTIWKLRLTACVRPAKPPTPVAFPIVINARTDVYLLSIGEPDTRFDHAIRRANAYRKAGADCLFVPRVGKPADIERIVAALEGPLNLLAFPGIPAVAELQRLGVARLSVGTWPTLAAMSTARKIAAELLGAGTYESMLEGAISYPEANRLMAARSNT